MDDQKLESLLFDLESDRVERKASPSDKDRICEAICAFANDMPNHRKPGVLFIGANDDGSCANLDISDQLLRTLSAIRSDGNILPLPAITVQKRRIRGCDLAVVILEPADMPPVLYRGRVWIRVGPRRAVASAQEERILSERRREKDKPYDICPVWSATLEDLDLGIFQWVYLPAAVAPEMLKANNRSVEEQLLALRFSSAEDPFTPTVVGMLTVGKTPKWFVGGAWTLLLRIDGTEWADPILDAKEFDGPLSQVVKRLDDVLWSHNRVAVEIAGHPTELRKADYPYAALQQLARNAILHRNYEGTNAPTRIMWFNDRIEFSSPGGPYGIVTRENFGQPGLVDYRNKYLAEAMRNLGFIQRFGVGLIIVRQELERNGNPPPEFIVDDSMVRVIVRKRPS